jgi:N-acylneuraminate cytidylyltransferase
MKNKIRRLAIIPARGNSKRIKNKNLKFFCGKPVIKYTIDNALKSKLFDKIHISTESKKIYNYASKLGIKPEFYRPKNLSKDLTSIFSVVSYVFNAYLKKQIKFDEIWLLTATSPLIVKSDLINASKFLLKNGSKYPLISVCKFKAPIEWSFTMSNTNTLTPINAKDIKKRSQYFKVKYFDTGSFAIFKPKNINQSNDKFYQGKFCGYEIDQHRSVDIDTIEDWNLAEKLYRNI